MGSKGFSHLKPQLLLNSQTCFKSPSENAMIIKKNKKKKTFLKENQSAQEW